MIVDFDQLLLDVVDFLPEQLLHPKDETLRIFDFLLHAPVEVSPQLVPQLVVILLLQFPPLLLLLRHVLGAHCISEFLLQLHVVEEFLLAVVGQTIDIDALLGEFVFFDLEDALDGPFVDVLDEFEVEFAGGGHSAAFVVAGEFASDDLVDHLSVAVVVVDGDVVAVVGGEDVVGVLVDLGEGDDGLQHLGFVLHVVDCDR